MVLTTVVPLPSDLEPRASRLARRKLPVPSRALGGTGWGRRKGEEEAAGKCGSGQLSPSAMLGKGSGEKPEVLTHLSQSSFIIRELPRSGRLC